MSERERRAKSRGQRVNRRSATGNARHLSANFLLSLNPDTFARTLIALTTSGRPNLDGFLLTAKSDRHNLPPPEPNLSILLTRESER